MELVLKGVLRKSPSATARELREEGMLPNRSVLRCAVVAMSFCLLRASAGDRVTASDTIDLEAVHWFGDPAQAVGHPYGPVVETGDGAVFGIAASARSGGSQVIYRLEPTSGALSVVAELAGVNAVESDGQGGLYATAGEKLLSVSASGVVGVIHVFSGVEGEGKHPVLAARRALNGWIHGVTRAGGEGDRGLAYRVRPDGSGFEVLGTLPGFPYGGVGAGSAGPGRLRVDRDGGVYGLLARGSQAFGDPPVFMQQGDSGIFRMDAEGKLTVLPVVGRDMVDAIERADGSFAVLVESPFGTPEYPPMLLAVPGTGGTPSTNSVITASLYPPVRFRSGIVLRPDGAVWAAAASGVKAKGVGSTSGGMVRFTLGSSVGEVMSAFDDPSKPWLAEPVNGLATVAGVVYGPAAPSDNSGCVYRVTDAGKLEVVRRLSVTGEARVPMQGPLVQVDGRVLLPTREREVPESVRIHRFDPATGAWDETFGTGPAGLEGMARGTHSVIVTDDQQGGLWLSEDGSTGETAWSRIHRFTPGGGSPQAVGIVNNASLHSFFGPAPLTRASDGNWYGSAWYGFNRAMEGFVFRVHPVNPGIGIVCTFPDDYSRGEAPFGGVIEAEPGWLYGMTQQGKGRQSYSGVYRVRLDGTGFQSLGSLGGDGFGGFTRGPDGNLYAIARRNFTEKGTALVRLVVSTRSVQVVGVWPYADYGDLYLTGPLALGGDGRWYVPGVRTDLSSGGMIASIGFDGRDPRVDAMIGKGEGGVFVGGLTLGRDGWLYGGMTVGGPSGGGGLVRLRPRPTIGVRRQASDLFVDVRAFVGARVRVSSATDPQGPWVEEAADVILDAQGQGSQPVSRTDTVRFYQARIRD